jgi:hypothetical protein
MNETYVKCKTNVTAVKIWATGIISKSFRKYMSYVLGKHETKVLQKTSLLGTAPCLGKY